MCVLFGGHMQARQVGNVTWHLLDQCSKPNSSPGLIEKNQYQLKIGRLFTFSRRHTQHPSIYFINPFETAATAHLILMLKDSKRAIPCVACVQFIK